MAADPIFLDTNILVASSVDGHPSHAVASAFLAKLTAERAPLCISPQVCREFLSVLTRQPLEGRTFSVDESLGVIESWRSACTVLDEDVRVLAELLGLVRRHQVKGKQVHDANIVATMIANSVDRIATFNRADFERYEDSIRIEALVS
jgi:predicted nucleic acid-binding protein